MLDPFLQQLPPKEPQSLFSESEEHLAQRHGRLVQGPAGHRSGPGLWLGKLLIKMGAKLAKQDVELKAMREHA